MELKELVGKVLEQLNADKELNVKDIKFNVALTQDDSGSVKLDLEKSSVSFEAKRKTKPAQVDVKF